MFKKSHYHLPLYILFLFLLSSNVHSQGNNWQIAGPNGADIRSIWVSKSDSMLIFIGTLRSGLYKSINSGHDWENMENLFANNPERGRLVQDIKQVDDSLYLGTDAGLFKSPDLGETWELIFSSVSGFLTSVVIDYRNPATIYISFYLGGAGAFSNNGIFKSENYGKTWRQVNDGLVSVNVTNVVMSNHDPNKLYATTTDGIYKTTDGGESGWIKISNNLPQITFTCIRIDENDPNVIYAGSFNGVFKSADDGIHWKNITGENFKSRFILPNSICKIGNKLLVGTQIGFYITDNDGKSWQEKNNGLENLCIHSVFAKNESEFYLGTAEGFYKSSEGGDNWQRLCDGLNGAGISSLAIDNLGAVYIGFENAGIYKSTNRGNSWVAMNSDLGSCFVNEIKISSKNTIFMSAVMPFDSLLLESPETVVKSEDSGLTWVRADSGVRDSWVTALALDPSDSNILFAGTSDGIFKSVDGGNYWFRSDSGLAEWKFIGSLAIDPQNSQTIYAGTSGGSAYRTHGIYKSTNGGSSWQLFSAGLPTNQFYSIDDIVINPIKTSTVYACFGRFGVYKTKNSGEWWEPKNNGIYNTVIYSVVIDPSDTNIVYAAGEKIFLSTDAGDTWQEIMDGVPENFGFVQEIRVDPNDPRYVYAATYGSGVLRLFRQNSGVNEDVQIIPETFALKQNYPNPFNPETRIEYSVAMSEHILLQIFNQRGQLIRTLVNEVQSPGSYMKIWDGKDDLGNNVASGIYLYRLQAGKFSETKKMIKLQ